MWKWLAQFWDSLSLAGKVAVAVFGCLAAAASALTAIAVAWGHVMTLFRWCLRKHDAPVRAVFENENLIFMEDVVCRRLPGRSASSIRKSIQRLEAAGIIYAAGRGYASSRVNDRIRQTLERRSNRT